MELRFTDKSSLTLSNNFYPLEHCLQLGSAVCGLREATLTEIEVAQKFFFLLLNVKPSGVIVYDSFTKLLKNIKNYRLLLKMKRKKMCKVNDNLVTLTIESTTSEVLFTDIKAI